MKPPAPLNYVRSFECAARHLSFTAAAKELGYTQAAVSTHVRALEHYIGRQLFIRYPRSLKLTEMGEAFLPTLRQALDLIDQATEAVVTSSRKRTVVVSCPMSLAENWMAGCIAALRKDHPEIEVVLHGTIWEDLSEQIADITISTRRFRRPSARRSPALERGACPALRASLAGRQERREGARGHIQGGLDLRPRPSGILAVRDDRTGLDMADYDKGLSTNASNIALELAAMGAGLVATQRSLARIFLQRGLLVEPFPVRTASPWNYYLRNPTLEGQCGTHGAGVVLFPERRSIVPGRPWP